MDEGTFNCPICQVATPHVHTSGEIARHRIETKSSARAKAFEDGFNDIIGWITDDAVAGMFTTVEQYRARVLNIVQLNFSRVQVDHPQ